MIHGHGGNIYAVAQQLGCRPEEIVDMSSNINPLGMPPGLEEYLHTHLHRIGALPEPDAAGAKRQMAELLGVARHRIMAGNGTTHFIYAACPALDVQKALIVGPTYSDYADACRMHRVPADHFLACTEDAFVVDLGLLDKTAGGYDVVFICNPNNPTGHLIPHLRLKALCEAHPETHFIIDESYLPFATDGDMHTMISSLPKNASVLWSVSKIFGVPGLRAGFLIAHQETISRFERFMQPWSLNALAQAAVEFLGTEITTVRDFIGTTRRFVKAEQRKFRDAIVSGGSLVPYPSEASYLLMALPKDLDAHEVYSRLAKRRILIRNCHNFHGLSDRYIRVALKGPEANRQAVSCLLELVGLSATSGH